jgi:hypothetical protein
MKREEKTAAVLRETTEELQRQNELADSLIAKLERIKALWAIAYHLFCKSQSRADAASSAVIGRGK